MGKEIHWWQNGNHQRFQCNFYWIDFLWNISSNFVNQKHIHHRCDQGYRSKINCWAYFQWKQENWRNNVQSGECCYFWVPLPKRKSIFFFDFISLKMGQEGTYNRKISFTIITSLPQVELFVNDQLWCFVYLNEQWNRNGNVYHQNHIKRPQHFRMINELNANGFIWLFGLFFHNNLFDAHFYCFGFAPNSKNKIIKNLQFNWQQGYVSNT